MYQPCNKFLNSTMAFCLISGVSRSSFFAISSPNGVLVSTSNRKESVSVSLIAGRSFKSDNMMSLFEWNEMKTSNKSKNKWMEKDDKNVGWYSERPDVSTRANNFIKYVIIWHVSKEQTKLFYHKSEVWTCHYRNLVVFRLINAWKYDSSSAFYHHIP